MKITAVRHGETIENVNRIVQGQKFGTLSETGLKQIEELGYKLQDHAFEKAYISDLERCVKTGAAILKFHPGKPYVYDERLRERSMAPEEGLPYNLELIKSEDLTSKTAEGESWLEVKNRILPLVDFVLAQPQEEVLFVTHGGPLRILNSIFTGMPLEEALLNNPDNCAVLEWEV